VSSTIGVSARRTVLTLAEGLVESLVDKRVGADVPLAADRSHRPAVELAQGAHGLQEERTKAGVLDLVLATDLACHKLGVVDDLDLARPELTGQLQAQQQPAVLGNVVRGLPDVCLALRELVAVRRARNGGGGRRSRVPARAPVDVDYYLRQARTLGGSICPKLPLGRCRRRSVCGG
jgi:hypothetical protein